MEYLPAVVSVVVVVFLAVLMAAAARGQPAADPGTGALVFRHNVLLRGFAAVSALGIPAGITALLIAKPPTPDDIPAVLMLYAGFAAVTAPLLWECERFALAVGPDGLDCRSPWRARQFFRWEEVERLSYNALLGYFVIHAAGGRTFRVSGLVTGLGKFLELCEQRLTPAQLQPAKGGYNTIGRPFPGDKK